MAGACLETGWWPWVLCEHAHSKDSTRPANHGEEQSCAGVCLAGRGRAQREAVQS